MLFGGHAAEEVPTGSLGGYIIVLFNAKSAKTNERCRRALSRLDDAIANFESASSKLGEVNAEPDLEFLGPVSPSSLAEQKARYVRLLAAETVKLRQSLAVAKGATEYEEILKMKELYDGFVGDLLKLNASFRGVFIGYSNYFGGIKKAFKAIEDGLADLGAELGRGAADFSDYVSLARYVAELNSLGDEMDIMSSEASAMAHGSARQRREGEVAAVKKLEEEIAATARELSALRAEEQSLVANINAMLRPLERVARKYDHESKAKYRLADALAEPLVALKDSESYVLFAAALESMRAKLGSIEANAGELELARQRIEAILRADLPGSVLEVARLKQQARELESELARKRAQLDELGREMVGEAEAQREARRSEERRARIASDMRQLADKIEQSTFKYYKRRIKIGGVREQ